MSQFNLSIPKQDSSHVLSIGNSSKAINGWIDALPVADPEKTLQQFLPVLEEMNRCVMDIDVRFHAMQQFDPVVDAFIESIRQKYQTVSYPLSGKNYERAVQVKKLLHEMAYGYKVVFSSYMAEKKKLSKSDIVLCLTLAGDYMARLILENYLLYEALVPKVWRELHTLFSFSSKLGFHDTPVEITGKGPCTIERGYMRVLLLAAIKPYRLMSGEAQKVYHQMGEWSHHCSLQQPGKGWQPAGEIIVDLTSDEAPYHVGTNAVFEQLDELRILNIERLKDVIHKRAEEVADDVKNSPAFALAKRQQRNMLSRLVSGWRSRNDRVDERTAQQKPIDVVCGLVDCHSIFSVAHEAGEQSVETRSKPLCLDDLSLTPREESWGTAPRKQVKLGQASQFKLDDPAHDIWEGKHALPEYQTGEGEQGQPIKHYPITQTDISAGGLGASFTLESGLKPRVGDLVAYRGEAESAWQLGEISWLAMSHTEGGGFGIRSWGERILPIFVKSIRGAGEGGDFMRALKVVTDEADETEDRLILPAAIYDIGTVLQVQGSKPPLQLQLMQLLDTSESFACFAYKIKER